MIRTEYFYESNADSLTFYRILYENLKHIHSQQIFINQ